MIHHYTASLEVKSTAQVSPRAFDSVTSLGTGERGIELRVGFDTIRMAGLCVEMKAELWWSIQQGLNGTMFAKLALSKGNCGGT